MKHTAKKWVLQDKNTNKFLCGVPEDGQVSISDDLTSAYFFRTRKLARKYKTEDDKVVKVKVTVEPITKNWVEF